MEKVKKFVNSWGTIISFVLVILIFFKTCNTNNTIKKSEEKINFKIHKLDSLVNRINKNTITNEEMVKLIKETPFWKSLELEELSDKNRVPINQLKNESEK